MIVTVIIVLIVISTLWSLWTLSGILKNARLTKGVKEELSKSRVVFHKDNLQSSSGSSSESDDSSRSGLGA